MWKPLPDAPGQFRLGADGLPWSAFAWPVDSPEPESSPARNATPVGTHPTVVTFVPEPIVNEDPEKTKELFSLSTAMVTVDNGFENQWWYQGPRETTNWWPRDQEEPRRMSMAEGAVLSITEPISAPLHGWYAPVMADDVAASLSDLVSPISTISSPRHNFRPLRRTLTTRSEEMFTGV